LRGPPFWSGAKTSFSGFSSGKRVHGEGERQSYNERER
jgi:hypothetical protein